MKTYRVWEVDEDRESGMSVTASNPKDAAEEFCARQDRGARTYPRRRSVIVQSWTGTITHFEVETRTMPMYAAVQQSQPFLKLHKPEGAA